MAGNRQPRSHLTIPHVLDQTPHLTMKAALCRYPIERLPSFDAWLAKLDRLTREAANSGASLLVFVKSFDCLMY